MRINKEIAVEPDQTFVVDRLRPEDAKGVAHLFYAEYGPSYPIETFYYPERIIKENQDGNIYSVVARTPKGDIIGHGALYRSSPHYQNLYEIGQCIILPDYRNTFAAYKINMFAAETLTGMTQPDGLFGEAVTHITATQKFSALVGMKDVALEMDLMPAEAYEKSRVAQGRVSCLILFKSFNDRSSEIFVPSRYAKITEYILGDVNVSRIIRPSMDKVPAKTETRMTSRFFPFARVKRVNMISVGADFRSVLSFLEKEGKKEKCLVFQFFLNLSEPWVETAAEILRKKGYFFGGLIPRWFDADGLLMQKVLTPPDFKAPRLHSAKAKKLLRYVHSDWQDLQG